MSESSLWSLLLVMTIAVGSVQDDRLRLIFTCCHPALSPEAQVALTLRLLGGLSTEEVARVLGSSEATVRSQVCKARVKIKGFVARYFGRRL